MPADCCMFKMKETEHRPSYRLAIRRTSTPLVAVRSTLNHSVIIIIIIIASTTVAVVLYGERYNVL